MYSEGAVGKPRIPVLLSRLGVVAFVVLSCTSASNEAITLAHISGSDDAPIVARIQVLDARVCVSLAHDRATCRRVGNQARELLQESLSNISNPSEYRPFVGMYRPEVWIEYEGLRLGYSLGSAPEALHPALLTLEELIRARFELKVDLELVE